MRNINKEIKISSDFIIGYPGEAEVDFNDTIKSVIGDEWHAGNLSYHLKSNPKWYSHSNAFVEKSADDFIQTIGKEGFIIVNGECSLGVSFTVKNNNICMYGKK